ncbi:hypothetical protein [Maribacter sp. 2308TA10-17]|uniref:hypothetical protein n=1 Tax=Maribacter sp. 2308TA10-17 TaxID=3386276 RepID=UPI0039BC5BA3
MVYLNYINLDGETQERLLEKSRREIETRHGRELKTYAAKNGLDYSELLNEEAIRYLYNFKFVFTV